MDKLKVIAAIFDVKTEDIIQVKTTHAAVCHHEKDIKAFSYEEPIEYESFSCYVILYPVQVRIGDAVTHLSYGGSCPDCGKVYIR